MDIYLSNTLTRKKERFVPIKEGNVGIYTCGPTVYSRAHIGNLRAYIFEDILKRVFLLNGYEVKHVMNITDVGHLTSDEDSGEDKMEKGAKKENISVWDIATKYTNQFMSDANSLNIMPADIVCKATDHIKEQIELVQKLKDKGFTYETSDGVYFDTSKLEDYGKLAKLDIEGLKAGARVEVGEKRNPTDFALWKFSPKNEKRQMEWNAFGKKGFPGWHIECSAMSMKYLGNTFDIHCGGIDHIPVHHTNEIAQSEAATGEKFVNYWLHNEFLVVQTGKMAKSEGNITDIDSLKKEGISPLDYRYFCMNTHYKKQLMFSIEGVNAAKSALSNLKEKIIKIKSEKKGGNHPEGYVKNFLEAVNDDLNIPKALGIMWDMLNDDNLSSESKIIAVDKFDEVLGLDLKYLEPENLENFSYNGYLIEYGVDVFDDIIELAKKRVDARNKKDFKKSDELRDKINSHGFFIADGKDWMKIKKK
jgi:cysteinyl-tRNA synthetase